MDFTKWPFGLPESVSEAPRVNTVLKENYDLQRNIGITNLCPLINIILQKGLEAIKVKSEVKHGCLKKTNGTRIQHVWLSIQGHVVDNTHCAYMTEEEFITRRQTLHTYEDIVPNEDTEGLSIEESKNLPKVIKWCLSETDKCLKLSQNKRDVDKYVREFSRFMKEEFSVDIYPMTFPDKICWNCGVAGDMIESCLNCKVAQYCNKRCKRVDWKKIHQEVCVVPD